jgi:heterodisulfide reductase subunit A-like polyferredoxin
MLPQVAPEIGAKVSGMPGVTLTVTDRCQGCGTCTEGVCFADAIHLVGGHAVISDACRHCGRCVDVCPHRAIELTFDGAHVAQTIERLSPLVDVT